MVLSINSLGSSVALSGIDRAQASQKAAVEKLVSGLRVNRAADDASGLSISTGLQSQIRGLNNASMNGQNAVSLLQTADGGLGQTTSQLQRVRDLTVQAAGTDDPGALSAISKEVEQSLAEIDQISQGTVFGSQSLLDGSLSNGTNFQIGASGASSDQFNVAIPGASQNALGLGGLATAINGGGASGALASIDAAINGVGATRTNIGAATNALGSAVSAIGTEILNATSANSQIMDADWAEQIVNSQRSSIQTQAGISVLQAQNDSNRSLLSLLRAG